MLLNFDSHYVLKQANSVDRGEPKTNSTARQAAAPGSSVSSEVHPEDRQTPHLAELKDRVAELNRIEALRAHRLEFSIHEGTGRMVVRVMDRETDEVLRQFPPDELLYIAERLDLGEPGSLSDSAA